MAIGTGVNEDEINDMASINIHGEKDVVQVDDFDGLNDAVLTQLLWRICDETDPPHSKEISVICHV